VSLLRTGTIGQFQIALRILQQQEALCRELGDNDGLQASYANQALVLRDWGRHLSLMASRFYFDVMICCQATYAENLKTITDRNAGYAGLKLGQTNFVASLDDTF
jgi:hypothetical protein